VATADGTALAHILHGDGSTPVDLDLVATTTFVYPPAAFVGKVGDAANQSGTLVPLAQNILAPETEHASDFYRIGVDPSSGALSGAEIICDSAADNIALFAALLAAKAPADVLSRTTPIHPSFAEEFFKD
jgi:glutathione reductase (NADPH)